MKARVEKYYDDNQNYVPKRTRKNEQLYDEIKSTELENLSIGSNAKVIGENPNQIDIDKIKEILEKNYQAPPKRRSVVTIPKEEEQYELEKTREYDINAILEKAREEKEVDYQKERLKKVRDTQYDILKNLDLDGEGKSKAANEKTKEELLDLIHTINLNEYQKKQEPTTKLDPLDILSDLKGDENTIVAEGQGWQKEEDDVDVPTAKEMVKEEAKDEEKNDMDTSFYTTSMSFSKDDFTDFDDIDEENRIGNLVIKLLIVLVFLAISAGVVFFLNDFLKLGWF